MSLTFEQKRKTDLAKEHLVPAAESLLDRAQVVKIKRNDLGESQLRNLIAIANETQSPAVVLNFIRYQMGRDSRNRNWSKRVGGETVGELFLKELEKGAIATALEDMASVIENGEEKQLVRIELFRHFLGFASRYMKFLDLQRPKEKTER
jgi:hypothetical protein